MTRRDAGGLDPEALSRPERSVFAGQRREVVRAVLDRGGCWYCSRRDRAGEGWGRATCGLAAPATFLRDGCTFEPDQTRIETIQGKR